MTNRTATGPAVTRRTFMGGLAALAGLASVGGQVLGSKAERVFAQSNRSRQDEWVPGLCAACMQADCGTLVHVVDGVVVGAEGNPDFPTNKGALCVRGQAALLSLHNPYRVKAPMKRTNPEKGIGVDPKWVEITWDEALDMVAQRLKAIRAKDPRGLISYEGFGDIRDTPLRSIWLQAFGTPNDIGTHGPLCSVHYASSLVSRQMPISVNDFALGKYVINLGRTAGYNFTAAGCSKRMADALEEKGLQFIDIDPRCGRQAAKAREWIPIRPNTELAFLLAMAHVMMYEIQQYDEWFLKWRTNAPYLIGPDGYYLRGATSRKPLIIDASDGKAKAFDDPTLKDPALMGTYRVNGVETRPGFQIIRDGFKEYTPEWAEEITTIPAETIRRLANEFVSEARIGATITLDGFTFPYRPVSVNDERGTMSHRGGAYADLTTKLINMMVGAMDVPGGCQGNGDLGPTLRPDADGVVPPFGEAIGVPFKFPPDHVDMSEFYPNKHTGPHLAAKAIKDPERYHLSYKVEAIHIIGADPFRNPTGPDPAIEAFKKVPFVFDLATFYDFPAEMSDVLLPTPCFFERDTARVWQRSHMNMDEGLHGLNMMMTRVPVGPKYNTRHAEEIWIELAERVGFLYGKDGFNDRINRISFPPDMYYPFSQPLAEKYKLDLNKRYSLEEIWDRQVRTFFDDQYTLADLKKKGFLEKPRLPLKMAYNYYYVPGKETRHPFYFNHLKEVGDKLRAGLEASNIPMPGWENETELALSFYQPVPHWVEPPDFRSSEYDMFAVNWKVPYLPGACGGLLDNPLTFEVADNLDPYDCNFWLHPETAARKGIQNGDTVVVESRQGKIEGTVILTQRIHPECIGIPGFRGLRTMHQAQVSKIDFHFNELISNDDTHWDPVNGGLNQSPKVKIYKA